MVWKKNGSKNLKSLYNMFFVKYIENKKNKTSLIRDK